MIKTLAGQVKEFKKDSIITPIFMILEVIMEMIIPLLMSSIIDDGVEKGDIHHIYIIGIWMVVAAGIGLFACNKLFFNHCFLVTQDLRIPQ